MPDENRLLGIRDLSFPTDGLLGSPCTAVRIPRLDLSRGRILLVVGDRRHGKGALRSALRYLLEARGGIPGTMRTNLVGMLDDLGLPSLLGVSSSSALFDSAANFVHTTSAIRYPVFIKGQNYTGHTPAILRSAFLRGCVDAMLASELLAVPHAIIVPLGNAVSETLAYLADCGCLSRERCLFGFPHPSGANGHRVRGFTANRDRLAEKMESHFRRMPSKPIESDAKGKRGSSA